MKKKNKFPLPMIFGEDDIPLLGLIPSSAVENNILGYQFLFLGVLVIVVAIVKLILLAMVAG